MPPQDEQSEQGAKAENWNWIVRRTSMPRMAPLPEHAVTKIKNATKRLKLEEAKYTANGEKNLITFSIGVGVTFTTEELGSTTLEKMIMVMDAAIQELIEAGKPKDHQKSNRTIILD